MMNILNKIYKNYRHPSGLLGRLIVRRMNGKQHAELAEWALSGVEPAHNASIVDIGCGGGATVARLLQMCPEGKVTGVDFAPAAVKIARGLNKEAIELGRCKILGGNAKMLPLIKDVADLATAFETIYYWPAFEECLAEVLRVLKPGGRFLIANNADGIDPIGEKWADQVGHMYIYTIDELKTHLTDAGFINITAQHDKEHHRICVIAEKPVE